MLMLGQTDITAAFTWAFEKFGLGGAIGIAAIYAGYRLLYQLGVWAKPIAETLANKHGKFLDTATETQTVIVEQGKKTHAVVEIGHDKTHEAIMIGTRLIEAISEGTPQANVVREHCREMRKAVE